MKVIGKHQGLIPSGTTARAGNGAVVGVAVFVGKGLAVGGITVGEGSAVLVAGTSVGVAVAGLRIGTAEQPAAEMAIAIMKMKKNLVLLSNIFAVSFKMGCSNYNIPQLELNKPSNNYQGYI